MILNALTETLGHQGEALVCTSQLLRNVTSQNDKAAPGGGRRYFHETFDRTTGEIVEVDLGVWRTVSEFGALHGLGARQIRAALKQMGLLQSEGRAGRNRLTAKAVEAGYGKRIDRRRPGQYPFDVLSPSGQVYAEERLDAALNSIAGAKSGPAEVMKASLECYKNERAAAGLPCPGGKSDDPRWTQQAEVCWLADHFPFANSIEISLALNITDAQVRVCLARRKSQRQAAS